MTAESSNLKTVEQQVEAQAAHVRKLKADGMAKDALQPEIEKLQQLKAQLQKLSLEQQSSNDAVKKFDRVILEELLRKRFFYTNSFAIYGGVSGLFDYGPPGCALQANILDAWRKHFILEEDMLEVDTTILTPHDVLKTSGHVDRFADLMCKDLKSGDIYRVDHLVEAELERRIGEDELSRDLAAKKPKGKEYKSLSPQEKAEYENILAQIDGYNAKQLTAIMEKYQIQSPLGNPLSPPEVFNLMFGTSIGPTGALKGFLRPETAQGQFLNFKKLLEFNNERMPFASAQIGRSFRNEISPRSGLLRVREFTMAEIEHFVHPDKKEHMRFNEVANIELGLLPAERQMQGKSDVVKMKIGDAVSSGTVNNQTLGYFMARIHLFLTKIGIKVEKLRFRQHLRNEMAHYACDCWDAEIQTSYGWIECVGCADRSAYDLTKHSERTKERLIAREKLKEPQIVHKLVLEINKKKFGPAFKKDAKLVETHLLAYDQEQLKELKDKLEKSSSIKVEIDSNPFEISSDLITVQNLTEKVHVLEYTPNVIEPSFGIGRILYSLLEHVWWIRDGDENRHVLSFPAVVAPTKCLLVPLSNNQDFVPSVTDISRQLRLAGISSRVDDSASSIGRRYARNDELGTPFGVTVDFQTIQDGTVTLRERDSTKQIREKVNVIVQLIKDMCEERTTWDKVLEKYPVFVQQELE